MASAKSKYILFFHTSRITLVCISINIYYPILKWRKTVACSKYNRMQALCNGVYQQLFVKLFISVTNGHTFVCLFSAIISEFIVHATNKY